MTKYLSCNCFIRAAPKSVTTGSARKLCQFPINMSATYGGKCSRNQFNYNGFCCVPGPDNNSTIFGSLKNRMSCVTDHTKGLEKDTMLLSSLHSWRIAYLTPSNALQEDQRCSGSSSAKLQNRHRLESSSILMRCLLNHPCPVKN